MQTKNGYQIRDQSKPHFMTFTVVDWIDVFSRQIYRNAIIDSLKFCQQKKGLILYGYVIMSNHVHVIMQRESGDLSDLLKDFKTFTAKKILDLIKEGPESRADWMLKRFEWAAKSHSRNSNYQFWKYGNHPEEIYSEKFFWSKLNYIHMNPVRAGIVSKASDYLYSSASNYVEGDGLIEVNRASIPVIDVLSKSLIEIDAW